MSTTQSLTVLLLAGIGLAFANTLASSGSALSLPVLLAVGLGPELANGTNRVAVLAGAVAATVTFVRAGRIQWPIVRPLMIVAAFGAANGAAISELVSPSQLHLAIVGALFVALALLAIRPSRWLTTQGAEPHVGPVQLLWIFLISVWAGFIVLDGMTYLLLALVLSVGLDVISANANSWVSMSSANDCASSPTVALPLSICSCLMLDCSRRTALLSVSLTSPLH